MGKRERGEVTCRTESERGRGKVKHMGKSERGRGERNERR